MIARLLARLRAPLPAERLRRDPPPPSQFEVCLAFVLHHEGKFVNHPRDPGGATNLGITLATLQHWRGRPTSVDDVLGLQREEAAEIYRARFWQPLRCDELPAGLDLMVFDFGVNAGPRTSARHLQRVLGVTQDGAIGPVTLGAARTADVGATIAALGNLRLDYYRRLPTWDAFGRGWERRTRAAVARAVEMAPS